MAWFWLTSYAELFAGISGARLQRMLVDMRAMMEVAAGNHGRAPATEIAASVMFERSIDAITTPAGGWW